MTQIITSNSWWWGWAWAYTYKWSVNTYDDLPTTWLKIWDVYNVITAHTTNPKFPAWSNLAWTGTEWDVLGWTFDLSEYQKKLVEGSWIDIDWNANKISVEASVISWAAAWATAVQPWDLATVATSWDYDDLLDKPTIWNATLTIQKNGTNVQTFTANATSNATANISVPTDTSDLTNGAWFITSSAVKDWTLTIQKNWTTIDTFSANSASNKTVNVTVPTAVTDLSDASNYQTVWNLVTNLTSPDDTHYPSAKAVSDALSWAWAWDMLKSVYDTTNIEADAFDYDNFYNTPTIPWVIDSLSSTSTTDALSANQWKELKDLIDTYVGLWRFLSLWDASTWQPISFPLTTPYTYNTWDWYMVETVSTATPPVNYMPNGSSYTWSASTTQDTTNNVEVRDVYIYDGTDWLFQKNNEVQVSFSDIAWNATDNTSLANALNAKADTSSLATVATSWDYDDLIDKPTIWTATLTIQKNGTTVDTFGANATSNVTANITVPTKVSDLSNDSWFVTNQVDDTAYAASWDWVTNKAPSKNAVYDKIESVVGSIPTVNDATLTIQKNGTTVNTFTANASSNVTANITVPTNTSDLNNDSGFLTSATWVTSVNSNVWAVTVNEVPSWWNNWDVLTNVSGTPTWAAPAAWWITNDTTGTTSTVTWIWAGSEAEYWNITPSWTVLYFTF